MRTEGDEEEAFSSTGFDIGSDTEQWSTKKIEGGGEAFSDTENVAYQIKILETELGIDNGTIPNAIDSSHIGWDPSILDRMKTLEDKLEDKVSDMVELEKRISKLEVKSDEGDPCEEYPRDCYAFIALNMPESIEKSIFVLFGLMVFLFQILFLLLLIVGGTMKKYGTVEDSGNPADTGFARFIPPNASTIVRASQVLSLLAYVVFPQSTLQDVVNAFRFWSSGDSCDPVWCIRFSCALKGFQGVTAIIAAWLLVMTSTTVVDIILNFTAITFISDLDELAFNLAESGMVGAALKEESERIAKKKIPACLDKKSKRDCCWIVMACTAGVLFASMIYVMDTQGGDTWTTKILRVEFNDEDFKQYSGCFHMNTESTSFKRHTYNGIGDNLKNVSFRYCRDNRQWRIFDGIGDNFKPCDDDDNVNGTELARSSKTDYFDISTSFEEPWVSSSGTPLDLYFFESDIKTALNCTNFLGDGKCDAKFNEGGYQYDDGDCCAASCTGSNCGRESNETVFGDSTSPEVAFNCEDPKMVPITIQLNSFTNSRAPEFDDFKPWEKQRYANRISESEWRDEKPRNTYFALDCNQKNVLTVYAEQEMEHGNQTVMVEDGANCTLNVRNTDDPTWFINYTLYHGDIQNERIEILTQQSKEKGKQEFKRYPNCYFEKLKDVSIDITSIYTASEPSYEAIRWLVEQDPNGSACQEEFFIQRYALAIISYNMSGEDILQDKTSQCTWPSITCNNGEVIQIDMRQKSLQGRIPTELSLLTSLEELDLSKWNLMNLQLLLLVIVYQKNILVLETRCSHCPSPANHLL